MIGCNTTSCNLIDYKGNRIFKLLIIRRNRPVRKKEKTIVIRDARKEISCTIQRKHNYAGKADARISTQKRIKSGNFFKFNWVN